MSVKIREIIGYLRSTKLQVSTDSYNYTDSINVYFFPETRQIKKVTNLESQFELDLNFTIVGYKYEIKLSMVFHITCMVEEYDRCFFF